MGSLGRSLHPGFWVFVVCGMAKMMDVHASSSTLVIVIAKEWVG